MSERWREGGGRGRVLAAGVSLVAAAVLFASCFGGDEGGQPGDGGATETAVQTPAATAVELSGLLAPMAIHLAPDGRVVLAEAGTGAGDGRVSLIDPEGGAVEVVMEGLPSRAGTGEPWGDVAGVTGAAVAPDGAVCAAVGIPASGPEEAVSKLVCTDGLEVDLAAWEAENDPDGLGPASRAFDVVADGDAGWWVSDAAANTVLHVDRDGAIELAGVFPTFGTFAEPEEGRPTGLFLAGESDIAASSIGPRGGIPPQGGLVVALFQGALAVVRPVEPADPGLGLADTPAAIAGFATTDRMYFLVHEGEGAGLLDTGRRLIWPGSGGTGVVRLGDGSFLVAVAAKGELIRVRPEAGEG